ncbi:response regulator [bacterium]|nr:response regulator [bacterium]
MSFHTRHRFSEMFTTEEEARTEGDIHRPQLILTPEGCDLLDGVSGTLHVRPDQQLRIRYSIALALIGFLTIGSLITVLHALRDQERDIPVVNIAGRQRMLSQKLAKATLKLTDAVDDLTRRSAVDELSVALDAFSRAQRYLEFGSDAQQLPSDNSDTVRAGLARVQPHFEAICGAVRQILKVHSPESVLDKGLQDKSIQRSIAAEVETILAHEAGFLSGMDDLVSVYEAEAKAHTDKLLRLLHGLASLFILVLLLEAFCVFDPAVRTIRRQMVEVARASAATAENQVLKRTNEVLEREVDRRRVVEEQLRQSGAEINRLLKLAGLVRHSVVVCDPQGRIQYVNEPYVKMTGYSLEELIGRKPGHLLQGKDTDRATAAAIRRHLRRREHFVAEILNYTKEGHPYWVSLEVEPVFDEAGQLQCFIGTHVDVTERKENEQALEHARRAAENASVAKSEFLARMSHEIRTPLNGILGFTELLRSREYSPEQQKVQLDTISSCGKHLLQLINDILDLSRIEAGKLTVCKEMCSPHQVICEVLSLLRVQAEQKDLLLECHWTTGVPETIYTDPSRLRQLLVNLVGNAIKFTESGSVTLQVAIDRHLPDPQFVIEVHDTGIGIPDEHLEQIFSPFDQADTSITRRFGGTGLGLAICRHITELLGGDISATSEVGVGSTFRVTLSTGPLDGVPLITEGMAEACRHQPGDDTQCEADLTGRRILLCDDGATNRELIGLVLQNSGATVEFAENGQQGLDAVEQHGDGIDLILMDMQMPVMDGYSATRKLRRSGWTKPVIALTAHAMAGDEEKCRNAGCTGFESKPINVDRLLKTVATATGESAEAARLRPAESTRYTSAAHVIAMCESPLHSTLPTEHQKFRVIVEKFVDRLSDQIESMETALARADCAGLAQLAHWLNGSGGTVGFDCFTEPARELERAARDHQLPAAEDVLKEIRNLQQRIELSWRSESMPETTV